MNATQWTETKPTEEGWYWLLIAREAAICHVIKIGAYGNRLYTHHPALAGITAIGSIQNELWAGPIPHPTEP